MAASVADAPVYSSYVEAWQAGSKGSSPYAPSRQSTEAYGPAGAAARLRQSRNFVEGTPLPSKPLSVLHRPFKPSAKNAENLDVQHERDTQAFERRASSYRRLAQNPYHHNAPPGSILTTFEQGNIVDRGRGRSALHEGRGVYDPVVHSYRVPPAGEQPFSPEARRMERMDRPGSAPHARGYAAIHASREQQRQQAQCQQGSPATAPQQPVVPTHHERSVTPLEHKFLQVSRGCYNPITHEFLASPEPDYMARKQKEFQRAHGLGNGMRRLPMESAVDPITGSPKPVASPAPHAPPTTAPPPPESTLHSAEAPAMQPVSPGPPTAALAAAAAARSHPARPTSAQHGGARTSSSSKTVAGPSFGSYNPLTHEWVVPPKDPKYREQEALVEKRLGVSGQSMARTSTPVRHGVYNPILNSWTVPPADPRVAEGLSFKPATLFSRPTPATIRM